MCYSLPLAARPDSGDSLMAINKRGVAAWLLVGLAPLVLAEKTAEPGDDFLEYLGSMESRDDNWSDLSSDDAAAEPADNTSAHESSSSSSSSHGSHVHHSSNTTGSKQ